MKTAKMKPINEDLLSVSSLSKHVHTLERFGDIQRDEACIFAHLLEAEASVLGVLVQVFETNALPISVVADTSQI